MQAVLMLKDGTTLYGKGFGARAAHRGELVFNTSMTGYQEALTDPSYAGQILLMTYPLIGNYGINRQDFESDRIHAEGFAVGEVSEDYWHKDAVMNANSFLKEHKVPGISGIDTRYLVRKIRNAGVMPAVIAAYDDNPDFKKLAEMLDFDYSKINFVEKVTTQTAKKAGNGKKHVVLIDYGVKAGIVRELIARGIAVTIVPSFFTAKQIKELEPDGIMLSNGPGDPAALAAAHETIRQLTDNPIFGICLGHQLLAHAFGGSTYKMKFGHRGSNHPVYDEVSKRVAITTHNHGYAVKEPLPADFELTHRNLNDKTVEGMRHDSKPIFSVQFHPEANPGPHDTRKLFDDFVRLLR
ncbi:MAG: glutamine-hydrolyzing carbamoyl-phosphate synthase small subunit [Candidatus Micrarchaeota archaeon]